MNEQEWIAREAIRRTITAYTAGADSRDREKYCSVWAEDGVVEFESYGPLPGFRCKGAAEIRGRTAGWNSDPEIDPSFTKTKFIRHNLTTSDIELTGADTANAKTYFLVFTEAGEDHAGTYTDELTRQGEDWRIKHRKIALNWRNPNSLFPPID